jgi:hypothetical protein
MDRRRFLLTSVAGALAAPRAVEAQQPSRIAFLFPRSCSALPTVTLAVDRAIMSGLTRAGVSDKGDLLPELPVLLRKEIALFALQRRLPTVAGDRCLHGEAPSRCQTS